MKIAYNPTGGSALSKSQIDSLKNDIIFDLSGMAVYARGIPVGKVYLPFEKSTSSTTEGYNGLVPFPDYNGNSKTRFLREDGTWVVPTNTNNYRPISINGTPILENNNTVLNLVAGNNITLNPKKDSNNKYTGEVTITASNHAWSNITGKPTTLAGYGITDAVTLGTEQIVTGTKTFNSLNVSKVATLGSLIRLFELDGSTLYNVIQRNSDGNILFGSDYTRDLYIDFDIVRVRSNRTIFSREVTAPSFTGALIGNADSATKLKAPRNIWGHNFDGTADVWGDLSYVKTIYAYNNAGLRISANSLDYSPTSVGELAGGLLISSDSAYGLSIWNDGSGKAYLQVGRTDGINTAYSLILQHLGGNVGIGTTSPTAKLHVNGDSIINGNLTAASFLGNLDGSYINKLTGYTKATAVSAITANDTLNAALGKLELKTDTAYNWYKSVTGTDNDDIINKWHEIVDFIDSVKEGTDITDEFVTRKTALTITGLKTFESNSETTGVSLLLKNKAWTGGMSTAMDFYNGSDYNVPNARIETKMVGYGTSGGTLIFYTQTKHASTNPNPNGLTERFRIGDDGSTKITGSLTVTDSASFCANSTGKAAVIIGSNWITGNGGADILNSNGSLVILGNGVAKNGWTTYIDGNEVRLRYSTTHAVGMLLNSSGNVGIGTTTPTLKLHVNGNALASLFMVERTSTIDTPALHINASNNPDVTVLRISTGTQSLLGDFGFSLKYLGTGGGIDNRLNLYTDNQTATEQVIAISVNLAGDVGIGLNSSSSYKLAVNGSIYSSTGFVKSGSTDSHVLLGAGGHKALSDFMMKGDDLAAHTITITKSIKLTKDWQETGIVINDATFTEGAGTYAVQVYINAREATGFWYSLFSGIASFQTFCTNGTEPDDEILLHHSSHGCSKQIYLKTKPTQGGSGYYNKLYIACNTACSTAVNIKFKFKKLI